MFGGCTAGYLDGLNSRSTSFLPPASLLFSLPALLFDSFYLTLFHCPMLLLCISLKYEEGARSSASTAAVKGSRAGGLWTGVFMDNSETLQSVHKSIKQPTFHHILSRIERILSTRSILETHDLREICLENIHFFNILKMFFICCSNISNAARSLISVFQSYAFFSPLPSLSAFHKLPTFLTINSYLATGYIISKSRVEKALRQQCNVKKAIII